MPVAGKKTQIRGTPPRVLIRQKDATTGSIPTISRTGDTRTGVYNIYFDDSNSIIFSSYGDSNTITNSVKNDPHLQLTSSLGRYTASASLVAYWQFDADDLSGDRFYRDKVGTHVLTGNINASFFSPYGPTKDSAGSILFPTSAARMFSTLDAADLSFGDGADDSAFSISCWIRPISDLNTNRTIIAKSGSTAVEWSLVLTDSNVPRLTLFDNSTGGTILVQPSTIRSIADSRNVNGWQHLAVTYDGNGVTGFNLYLNGIGINGAASTVGAYTAMENTAQIVTVANSQNLGNPFVGSIDDLAIFNTELSANQIRQIAGHRSGISMPTCLPAVFDHTFLTEDLRTDIFVSSTIISGLSDQFVSFTPGQDITPFYDSNRPEQSITSSFFLTGSEVLDVFSEGFTSPLKSKTQIKLTLPITTETTFLPQTASIMYYNWSTTTFDFVATNENMPPNGDANNSYAYDAKLFGPLGYKVMSGNVGSNLPSPFHGKTIQSSFSDAKQYINTGTVTLNSNFIANVSQSIAMKDYINHPFLLEKAVIKLPLSASSNWLNDFTLSTIVSTAVDVGGPCITVGLLNQRDLTNSVPREIILSATIIPSRDNTSFLHQGQVAGFLGHQCTPSAVVTGNLSGPSFIGNVSMECQPGISNGVISVGPSTSSFYHSRIVCIDPIGRSGNVQFSGRSYFGRDFISQPLTTGTIDLASASTVRLYKHYNHVVSPYILFPTDNIVLSISKYRPVATNVFVAQSVLTGSHTLSVYTGTVEITLYGSLISDEQEFHDTLNQPLTSLALTEMIHSNNPVLDQFDIEPKLSFLSGSIDHYITGSMVDIDYTAISVSGSQISNIYLTGSRIVIGSNALNDFPTQQYSTTIRPHKESTSFKRYYECIDTNERFYDSLLPRPDKIWGVYGKSPALNVSSFFTVPIHVFYISRPIAGALYSSSGVSDWVFAFPFEPKFSAIERTTSPFRSTKATVDTNGAGLSTPSILDRTTILLDLGAGTIGNGDFSNGANVYRVSKSITSSPSSIPDNETVAKVLFGFGTYNSGTVEPKSSDLSIVNVPNFIARGVKYGLINYKEQYTKAIFRHNMWRGMVSDMIQQRQLSKFRLENGTTTRSPVTSIIFRDNNPTGTFSSNISNEATSSVPYFDGTYKNRSTLLSGTA